MARYTEDETPEKSKVEDNEEEKNENTLSRSLSTYTFEVNDSKNQNSASDIEDKRNTKTPKTAPKYKKMKQRIKILKQEVKIAEMKIEIIKHEINNLKNLQGQDHLEKKYKTNLYI